MKSKKCIFWVLILLFAGGIIFLNIVSENKSLHNRISFSAFYQVVGNVTSSVSRGVGSALPIDSLDEKKLGDELKQRYKRTADKNLAKETEYLNTLLSDMNWAKSKKFDYQIFVVEDYVANSYALPGGVVIVTDKLFDVVGSESEILAVIAHEIGHIENSHCLNAVKYEVLTNKFKLGSLGKVADVTQNLLLRHSYSKTQEAEADEYAFMAMESSPYDVMSVSNSFQSLLNADNGYERGGGILSDYFRSHPSLKQRVEKFKAKSIVWKKQHKDQIRYIGKQNLKERIPLSAKNYGGVENV